MVDTWLRRLTQWTLTILRTIMRAICTYYDRGNVDSRQVSRGQWSVIPSSLLEWGQRAVGVGKTCHHMLGEDVALRT